MLKSIQTIFVGLTITLLITACGPSEQEIKSLGFSNAAEMKEIQAKGFKTKQEYETQTAQAEAERQAALEAQKKAEMQEQADKAIKVYKRREWVEGWSKFVTYLNIQSVSDRITISQVSLNRGRCQFYWVMTDRGATKFPVQAQFGNTVKIDLDSPPCDLIEVEVTTNLGTTSYSF
jgi:hypothetical protein